MFDNIGGKMKNLSTISCWMGIGASIIAGIVLISAGMIGIGVVFFFVGSLFSWISSFLLYGFGELIEKVSYISDHMQNSKTNSLKQEPKHPHNNTMSSPKLTPNGIMDIPKRNKQGEKYDI